jgi:hypothetical protein
MKQFYTCSAVSTPSTLEQAGASPHPIFYTYEINTPLIATDTDDIIALAVSRVQKVVLESVAAKSGLDDCIIVGSKEREGDWRGLRRKLLPRERGSTSIVGVSLLPGDVVDEDGEFLGGRCLIFGELLFRKRFCVLRGYSCI